MRLFYFLFLLAFGGAVGVLAYQNQQEITLVFLQWSETASFPVVAGIIYLLGMLSGWTILGIVRRSVREVVSSPRQPG